jgi:hypothetical protein
LGKFLLSVIEVTMCRPFAIFAGTLRLLRFSLTLAMKISFEMSFGFTS